MLQRDFDERLGDFAARPYFRAFVGFICELEPPEPVSAAQFGHLQVTADAGLMLSCVMSTWSGERRHAAMIHATIDNEL